MNQVRETRKKDDRKRKKRRKRDEYELLPLHNDWDRLEEWYFHTHNPKMI